MNYELRNYGVIEDIDDLQKQAAFLQKPLILASLFLLQSSWRMMLARNRQKA